MIKDNEIPFDKLRKMEPTSYADGDFDIGVWQDEVMDMKADDISAAEVSVNTDGPAGKTCVRNLEP